MVITIDQDQENLLNQSSIAPIVLVDITSAAGTVLRFCTNKATTFNGNLYQPYLATLGNIRSSATFPDNHTANRSFQLHFNNSQIELNGVQYSSLSETFYPVFPWELAEVTVKILLTSGTEEDTYNGSAIPWLTSGTADAPTAITRDNFLLPVHLPDFIINDQLPFRVITREEFPEADRDELDGNTAIPILVGSGVTVRARATTAGAATTVRTSASSGFVLEVTSTEGWSNADDVIIGGMVNNGINISSVDSDNLLFNLSTDLNTLPSEATAGMSCIEDRATYDFTVADHECAGGAIEVFVTKLGTTDRILVDPSKYTTLTVDDSNAIGGKRTDLRITELTPFGDPDGGGVTQPVVNVTAGNHKHDVALAGGGTETEHFAGGVTPAGGSPANDGNAATLVSVGPGGTVNATVTWTSHPNLNGTFNSQTYFMIAENIVYPGGDIRMRRSSSNFLTLTSTFAKGEFRSSADTGGSETSTWNVIGNENSGSFNLYEGWKMVTMTPTVSEATKDLRPTNLTTSVAHNVSAGDIEIGEKVEITINGVPIPDDSGRFGLTTASGEPIERPDAVMRWVIEEALDKEGLIDETTYSEAASDFQDNDIRLRFAINSDKPIKVNALLDQIASNSRATHWWGREAHNVKYLPATGTSVATFADDISGVTSINWQNNSSSFDLRNNLTAYYDREWTQGETKSEAYTSSVLGIDLASIAVYGTLSNVINDRNTKSLRFDMLTTASGAQNTVDEVVGHISFPKKVFSIETAWNWMNLEPGDRITVNTETLATGVEARIIEHEVDSRFQCHINAIETSSPVSTQYNSSNASFTNTTDQSWGFGPIWTMQFTWLTRAPFSTTDATVSIWDFVQISPLSDKSRITVTWKPLESPNPQLWVNIFGANGTDEKLFQWDNLLTPANVELNTWYNLFLQFTGINIRLWFGKVGATGSPIIESSQAASDFVSMNDIVRRPTIFAGAPVATVREHQFKIWNTPLTDDAITYVGDNPHADLTVDSPADGYNHSGNLVHWYKLGHIPTDPGADFAVVTASGRVNINVPPVIGTDRIFIDAPGITGEPL